MPGRESEENREEARHYALVGRGLDVDGGGADHGSPQPQEQRRGGSPGSRSEAPSRDAISVRTVPGQGASGWKVETGEHYVAGASFFEQEIRVKITDGAEIILTFEDTEDFGSTGPAKGCRELVECTDTFEFEDGPFTIDAESAALFKADFQSDIFEEGQEVTISVTSTFTVLFLSYPATSHSADTASRPPVHAGVTYVHATAPTDLAKLCVAARDRANHDRAPPSSQPGDTPVGSDLMAHFQNGLFGFGVERAGDVAHLLDETVRAPRIGATSWYSEKAAAIG